MNSKQYHLLLLTLFELAPQIFGKTIFQKMIYFSKVKFNLGIDYIPYHYGPYSVSIDDSISTLKGLGYINEQVEVYGLDPRGFEKKKYIYSLKDDGKEVFKYLKNSFSELYQINYNFFKQISENIDFQDVYKVSIAAKTLLIIRRFNLVELDPEIIRIKALDLSWEIESKSIEQALDFLKKVELI